MNSLPWFLKDLVFKPNPVLEKRPEVELRSISRNLYELQVLLDRLEFILKELQ